MNDDDAREIERQRRIADACLGEARPAEGRLGLYRRLIQGNLAAVARRLLPRTASALDSHDAGAFDAWFARFLAGGAPRTAYLRDVPVEFVAWASPVWESSPAVPSFIPDLARHETDLFSIENTPGLDRAPGVGELELARPLVFATPRKLARYDHAVPDTRKQVTYLLLHRDEENTVHTTMVEERRASLLALLLEGTPLDQALARAGAASEPREIAAWLAQLGDAGALLGGLGRED